MARHSTRIVGRNVEDKEKSKSREKSQSKSMTNLLKNENFHKCCENEHLLRDFSKSKNGKVVVR